MSAHILQARRQDVVWFYYAFKRTLQLKKHLRDVEVTTKTSLFNLASPPHLAFISPRLSFHLTLSRCQASSRKRTSGAEGHSCGAHRGWWRRGRLPRELANLQTWSTSG